MKTLFILSAALVAAIGPAAPASAKDAPSAIRIVDAWIASPPNGAPTAAGYAVIENRGATPDVFVSGSTPAAETLQLHAMSMSGGVMRMRSVEGGLSVAPGASVALAPGGGYHLMFVHPKASFAPGERIPAILVFAKAGAIRTVFVVKAP